MAEAIWIKYEELSAVSLKLKDIVSELEGASSRTDAVQDAIDSPFGKSKLKDEVGDFESRWDDKRHDLARDIGKVQEHVQGVLDGCKKWDEDTAKSMEVDATGQNPPRKIGTP